MRVAEVHVCLLRTAVADRTCATGETPLLLRSTGLQEMRPNCMHFGGVGVYIAGRARQSENQCRAHTRRFSSLVHKLRRRIVRGGAAVSKANAVEQRAAAPSIMFTTCSPCTFSYTFIADCCWFACCTISAIHFSILPRNEGLSENGHPQERPSCASDTHGNNLGLYKCA